MEGLAAGIRYMIVSKLEKAGAVSRESAVTPEEAGLNLQEIGWLAYLAGGVFSTIKKTEDGRYYIHRR